EIGASMREGFARDAPHGTIDCAAAAAELGLSAWPLSRPPVRFGIETVVDVGYASFSGRGGTDAVGTRFAGLTSSVRGGLASSVAARPIRFSAGVAAGGTTQALDALDNGVVATGMAGLLLYGELGASVLF